MKLDDGLILGGREFASLDIGAKVVVPTQAAALPTTEETSFGREGTPATMAMLGNERSELMIFIRGPGAFVKAYFDTARGTAHNIAEEKLVRLAAKVLMKTQE